MHRKYGILDLSDVNEDYFILLGSSSPLLPVQTDGHLILIANLQWPGTQSLTSPFCLWTDSVHRCPEAHIWYSSKCVPIGRTVSSCSLRPVPQAVRILLGHHSAYQGMHVSKFCMWKYNLHTIYILIYPRDKKKGDQDFSPKIEDMAGIPALLRRYLGTQYSPAIDAVSL